MTGTGMTSSTNSYPRPLGQHLTSTSRPSAEASPGMRYQVTLSPAGISTFRGLPGQAENVLSESGHRSCLVGVRVLQLPCHCGTRPMGCRDPLRLVSTIDSGGTPSVHSDFRAVGGGLAPGTQRTEQLVQFHRGIKDLTQNQDSYVPTSRSANENPLIAPKER